RDRDVVLSRADVEVTAASGSRYEAAAAIRLGGAAGAALESRRAWARVEVAVAGRRLRFVTTHLETPAFLAVQVAQARELLEEHADGAWPTVLVGDFNSGPGDASTTAYEQLLAAGFADTWAQMHPDDLGATCGQAEDLRNPVSSLSARIDLVLTRGVVARVPRIRLVCRAAARVGHRPEERTPSGLWPSDHAGRVASLSLE
ncbi:MAG: endonuclease/exonuclease/phosphatase family protein, partial [Gemmatimonadota bacterium]